MILSKIQNSKETISVLLLLLVIIVLVIYSSFLSNKIEEYEVKSKELEHSNELLKNEIEYLNRSIAVEQDFRSKVEGEESKGRKRKEDVITNLKEEDKSWWDCEISDSILDALNCE